MFIAIEGIDGSGTTTAGKALAEKFIVEYAQNAVYTHEPWDFHHTFGSIMKMINTGNVNHKQLALLFAFNRFEHFHHFIKPQLELGAFVISDRYIMSSFAYHAHDTGAEYISSINALVGQPDITFLLDIEPREVMERMKDRNMDSFEKDLKFQQLVRESYLYLAKKDDNCVVIDATQNPMAIVDIMHAAIDLFKVSGEVQKKWLNTKR